MLGGRAILVAVAAAGVLVVAPALPLVLFAAIVAGVFLRSVARGVASLTRIPAGAALAGVVFLLVAVPITAGVLLAPGVARDLDAVAEALPQLGASVRAELGSRGWGRALLRSAGRAASEDGAAILAKVVGTPASAISGLVVVAIMGLFLAADPAKYVRGAVALVPAPHRARTEQLLLEMGGALRRHLLARAVSMSAVGVLTAVALALLGVPLAVPVAVVVGLVTFVPYVGPLVGTVPVAAAALAVGTSTLVWALVAYAAIQWAEGFILAPLVEQKAVSVPPALVLGAQVAMGFVFGPLGVVVALPLAAVTLVATRRVWIERASAAGPPGGAGAA